MIQFKTPKFKAPKIRAPKISFRRQPVEVDKTLLKKLEDEQARLEKEIEKLKKYQDYGSSEDENVKEIEEYNEKQALLKEMNTLLSDTRLAIKKLYKGSYGKCEICKNEIAPARLNAIPSARLCIGCQSQAAKRPWWKWWKR